MADERGYQVLDYVEFLESKYAERQTAASAAAANPLSRFADAVEEKLRAGRMSASTIAETMNLMNKAVGVLNGAAAAGKSAATAAASSAGTPGAPGSGSGTTAATEAGGSPPAGAGASTRPNAGASDGSPTR